jgi:hypothetical protein
LNDHLIIDILSPPAPWYIEALAAFFDGEQE